MTGTEDIQSPSAEALHADELTFLGYLPGERPAGWAMTPEAVVHFICGTDGEKISRPNKVGEGPRTRAISRKFVGDRALIERCVVTLAGQRGLMLVGEPGTAKSMLSELLAAAISGSSERTVQGTAGTDESHLRYGWNYASLIAKGPHIEALIPSPVLEAMREGKVARVEEITRCLPEIQDAMVSILSERRIAIPELRQTEYAKPGFNVIGTANLRDRGVSEMSAALKRRFNFERVNPIAEFEAEVALVQSKTDSGLAASGAPRNADEAVIQTLVTLFRDLRTGKTPEGWTVEKPGAVMSTAEVVEVASALFRTSAFFSSDPLSSVPGYLLGVVVKDDDDDRERLLAYWDGAVKRRADEQAHWKTLYEARGALL